jgi:hypothetical protein
LEIISLPPALISVALAMPPANTATVPPEDRTSFSPVPREIASIPPELISVALAVPPAETYSRPP